MLFILFLLNSLPYFYYITLAEICETDKLPVGEKRNYTLINNVEKSIEIVNLTSLIIEAPPRIDVSCANCVESSPALVVVKQRKGVLSWELPLDTATPGIENQTYYSATSRTLCPFDIIKNVGNESDNYFIISLSTSSVTEITVTLLIELETKFVLQMNKAVEVNITAASPRFYVYKFIENKSEDSVLLKVSSYDDTCMAVSVQHIKCPVFDLEKNVEYDGYWQSVTRSSGITIPRESFPNGFYVVFVVRSHDSDCDKHMLLGAAISKSIVLTVMPTITQNEYIVGVSSALAGLLLFCLLFGTLTLFYMRNVSLFYLNLNENVNPEESAIKSIESRIYPSSSASNHSNDRLQDNISILTDSSIDETDLDLLPELQIDKNIWRSKSGLFVADLSKKKSIVLGKKSQLYLWLLLTVFTFYFLPVVQLVITYQKILHSTGNQNLCYYNFLCAHPLGLLSDFNHVYSNAGYIVLGGLFILLTRHRQQIHKSAVMANGSIEKAYGIPQHFGLLFAMGAALVFEGILSACYHVCPNHQNFQFDTSFMYVISVVCMLKIYHTRHPDVSASAYATFAVLAGIILLGMCGVMDGTPAFWSVFTLIHLFTCFMLSVQIYYLGCWRIAEFNCVRVVKECYVRIRAKQLRAILPTFPSRFIIIMAANVVNWALAVLGPMYRLGDFASYLLMIFMVNLMLYCTFYIIMKKCSKERINRTAAVYILLSIVAWSFSLYFFINKAVSWKVTPAQSRRFNQPCKLLNFYDNHDIWHFLSAASMFFSFMVLLTLDDDLVTTPRELIAVF